MATSKTVASPPKTHFCAPAPDTPPPPGSSLSQKNQVDSTPTVLSGCKFVTFWGSSKRYPPLCGKFTCAFSFSSLFFQVPRLYLRFPPPFPPFPSPFRSTFLLRLCFFRWRGLTWYYPCVGIVSAFSRSRGCPRRLKLGVGRRGFARGESFSCESWTAYCRENSWIFCIWIQILLLVIHLRQFFFHWRVPMIFNWIVCSSAQKLRDLRPSVS